MAKYTLLKDYNGMKKGDAIEVSDIITLTLFKSNGYIDAPMEKKVPEANTETKKSGKRDV